MKTVRQFELKKRVRKRTKDFIDRKSFDQVPRKYSVCGRMLYTKAWCNHREKERAERFCYCWDYGENNTEYCKCYKTWKDRTWILHRIMLTTQVRPTLITCI